MAIRPQQVWTPIAGLLFGLAAFAAPCQVSAGKSKLMLDHGPRFTFTIPPNAPLSDLLPTPPATALAPPSPWNNDLAKVPEVAFGVPVSGDPNTVKARSAHILAKINHLNDKATDGFMTALLGQRADLCGMPFLLGDDCRADKKQAQLFAAIANIVRTAMARAAWDELAPHKIAGALVEAIPDIDREAARVEPAIVGAMMQMITPGSKLYGPRLPKRLAAIAHPDAARALVSLALFSPDAKVREAAVDGLKPRRAGEYTEELLAGFRYPLPAAAERSADAFVKLERQDIQAKLAEVLEQPDPRAPKSYWIDGKNYMVLRELVRVNHHRNCVLCHAPGNAADAPSESLFGEIPMPNEPFGGSPGFYGIRRPSDIVVRIDVTYLRQDFSLVLPVKDSKPWPNDQRFDYFVRTRVISPEDAAECDRRLRETAQPYHAAALQALLALTSPDFRATPQVKRPTSTRPSPAKPTTPKVAPATQPAAFPKPTAPAAQDSSSLVLAIVGTIFILIVLSSLMSFRLGDVRQAFDSGHIDVNDGLFYCRTDRLVRD